jgi:myosin heavy subunit
MVNHTTPKTQQRGDRLREEIFAIADVLLQEGQRPTINKVAQRLGHGSNTTIGEALEVWWSLLHSRLESAFNTPAVDSEVIDLAESLWKRALEKASAQYQEEKKQLEKSLAISQEENTLLHRALQEQQSKFLLTENALEQLLSEKKAWEEEKQIWQNQLKTLEKRYQEQSQAMLKQEAEQQAALLQQQKMLHELSEALHQQLQQHQEELKNLQQLYAQKLSEQQQQYAALQQENIALSQYVKNAEAETLQWQTQVAFLKEVSEKQEAINQERYLEQKQSLARLEQERNHLTKVISNLQKKAKLRRKFNPPDSFF